MNYQKKYYKYKAKYIQLKKLLGGDLHNPRVYDYNTPKLIKDHLKEYDDHDLLEEFYRYRWIRDEAKSQNNKPKCLDEDAKVSAIMSDGRIDILTGKKVLESSNNPIQTNMILFRLDDTPLQGGSSYNVWPVISMKWHKNINLLGIKSVTDDTIKYSFITHNRGHNYGPILGAGSYSAVYEIENLLPSAGLNNRNILKIYEKTSDIHLFNDPKVKTEMELYKKYFMKIFYYGEINIEEKNFILINKNNDYKIDETTAGTKPYNFEYYITKKYNIAKIRNVSNKYFTVSDLTNSDKYKFLINNLIFLRDLQDNNMFHGDYKIENIGWENDFDIIMIDYDNKTILPANDTVDLNNFPKSYIPNWLFNELLGDKKTMRDYSYLNKWSVGGLYALIEILRIEFSPKFTNNIELPPRLSIFNNRRVFTLSPRTILSDLKLDSSHYDEVPLYSELIELFEWLKSENYIH